MTHIPKFAYFILSSIILSACTPHLPRLAHALHTPQTTRNGTLIVHSPRDFSHIRWWKKMHDPVLNRLIQDALVHNNQLKTAEANMLQAQAKLKEARAAWLPTLSANGNSFIGGSWDMDASPQGPLANSPVFAKMGNAHFKGYYSGFTPSYSLNILQNINADKLAKASFNMQKAAYQAARLTVISQVSGAYFMLLGHKAEHKVRSQLIHDLKKSRQLEWVRFKDGASDFTNVTQLDKQIANNEALLPTVENSISQVENAIQVLLSLNPGPIKTHQRLNALSIKGLIPANLPSSVLKHRPDVIMARENLNISLANIGLAYSQFFPKITLTGMLGAASIDLSHLLKLNASFWVAQAAASMVLINGAAYEQIAAAKAGADAIYFSYIQTVLSVFADVDNSLTNQQKVNEAYQQQFTALKAAQQTYTLALARYKAGAKDYRDVINAKINVDNARLLLNTAKIQQLDSIVEVYQALGGGYDACNLQIHGSQWT